MHSEHEAQSEEGVKVERLLLKTGLLGGWRAGSPVLLPPSPELLGSLLSCLDQPFWPNPVVHMRTPRSRAGVTWTELAQACLVLAGVCGVEVNEGPRGQRSEMSETRRFRNM